MREIFSNRISNPLYIRYLDFKALIRCSTNETIIFEFQHKIMFENVFSSLTITTSL